jgi:hypothetical protein
MSNNQTISLRLEPTIYAAAEAHSKLHKRELGDLLVFLITDGLLRAGAFDQDPGEARKLRLREELLDAVVACAAEIATREEGVDIRKDITAATCAEILEDAGWRAKYEEFVEADALATGVQLKNRINPRIGARIKSGLGLHSRLRDDGRTETYNVSGNIIQFATALTRLASPKGK